MFTRNSHSFNHKKPFYQYTSLHNYNNPDPLIQPSSSDAPIAPQCNRSRHGSIPIGAGCLVILAVLFSFLFISTITLAYVGASDSSYFQDILNGISQSNLGSGIVLLGENVDIDIEEPAVTVRWSIVACGSNLVLPDSQDIHGSVSCGIPSIPMKIYVDSSDDHDAYFDPRTVPIEAATRRPTDVQRLLQFDSDHVLDVHNARFYPFDTYTLTSTLRVVSDMSDGESNSVLPIIRLPVIQTTSSFVISSTDSSTFVNTSDGDGPELSRDVELRIRRPGDARAYAMLLFGLNWTLAHLTLGFVILAIYRGQMKIAETDNNGALTMANEAKDVLKQLAGILAIMLVIPQLRAAMPDAPGLDGVIIDSIGYFPQMILCASSAVALALILVKRELERIGDDNLHKPLQATSPDTEEPFSSHTPKLDTSFDKVLEQDIERAGFLPLPRGKSVHTKNHFRNKGHTTYELQQIASSAVQSFPDGNDNSSVFNHPLDGCEVSNDIAQGTIVHADKISGPGFQKPTQYFSSLAKHSKHARNIAEDFISSMDRWNLISREEVADTKMSPGQVGYPNNDLSEQVERLARLSPERGVDYSTGVDSHPTRTSRFSFLRSRKPSLCYNSLRNSFTSAVIPEETLLEVFGERAMSQGDQRNRGREEKETSIRDIRSLKWA